MSASQSSTPACARCTDQGYTPSPIHYVQLGLSPVTYCRGCPVGRRLLKAWSREPEQRAYTRRLKADRVARALELSQLGIQLAGCRLTDLRQPAAAAECTRYVQQWATMRRRGQGLYLWGPVGSGKTHAAAAVVNELIEERLVETLFLNVPEAAGRLRQALREDTPRRGSDLLDQMKRVELLVLDGLGLEKRSAWVGELLYRVIDERWRQRRPMLVTSCLSPAELARRYPPQIASRIDDCCQALELSGRRSRQAA